MGHCGEGSHELWPKTLVSTISGVNPDGHPRSAAPRWGGPRGARRRSCLAQYCFDH